jgi:CheY-like chemotaxis protein
MGVAFWLQGTSSAPERRGLMEVESDRKKPGIGKTVLVVDDSVVIRKMLAFAFLSEGFKTCVEAENGKAAIDIAQQSKPDVIILDLSMPVMNGLQSAPQLRKILPQTPIILFTLYGKNVSQTDAFKAGISLVLEKSVPLPTVVEKVHELLGELESGRCKASFFRDRPPLA